MYAWVFQLWEEGRQIPRWQFGGMRPIFGELVLSRVHDSLLRRTVLQARLLHPTDRNKDQLAALQDAAVTGFEETVMHVSGIQTDRGKTTAQTWQVLLVPDKARNREDQETAELNMKHMPVKHKEITREE